MKRSIVTLFLAIGLFSAVSAQPRAIGLLNGVSQEAIVYQHSFRANQFLDATLGLDLGYNVNGHPGFRATGIYEFIWGRPAWTDKGRWALYSGPGITTGYVDDIVPYEVDDQIKGWYDHGFMLAFVANIGLEYTFWFPMSLSVDIRPAFGFHINDGKIRNPLDGQIIYKESKVGFYDNGLLGFAPSISVKYMF